MRKIWIFALCLPALAAGANGPIIKPNSTVKPGGSSGQVQYNSGGAFGGSSNLTYDGMTLTAPSVINTTTTFTTGVGLSVYWDNIGSLHYHDVQANVDMEILNLGSNLFYLPQLNILMGGGHNIATDYLNSASGAGINYLDGAILYSRTLAQLNALTPGAAGEMVYCSDCTIYDLCISSGTGTGAWTNPISRTTHCQ